MDRSSIFDDRVACDEVRSRRRLHGKCLKGRSCDVFALDVRFLRLVGGNNNIVAMENCEVKRGYRHFILLVIHGTVLAK
jgi:hypothetical protein